jgi:hypothetical protein
MILLSPVHILYTTSSTIKTIAAHEPELLSIFSAFYKNCSSHYSNASVIAYIIELGNDGLFII